MTGQEYDVVVVGSGAAGMVAALTAAHQGLSTVVVEKAPHYGGSTARSGGGVWIPNNEILKRDGVKDTPEAARTYLHKIIGDVVPAEKIDTYLDRSPEMLSFVLKHSPLKLCWVPGYSDYYPETPGGKPTGRSVEPKPFNAKKLGVDEKGLEPPYGKVPMNMVVMQQDYVRLNQLKRHPRGVLRSLKVGVRSVWANATGKNLVGMGRALIAPLRIGLQQAGVPVQLNTALTDLYVEDGVVRGVYVVDPRDTSAEPQLIRARRAVILGSGGFEHNEQMRVKYQRAPITTEWTVGAVANTGDGILAAEKQGAALEFMEDSWWGPTVPLVDSPWFALSERNSPGSIIVNMAGKRFMNESMPYVEACHHMYGGEYGQGAGPGENIPAWLIFDQQYRDRFIFAGLQPGQRIPKKWLESGVIVKADTLEELAAKTGLPADAFAATIDRFNGFARSGVDEDFHRGESAYDRYYGDPTNKPNPNLGEIKHGPYYAAKMVPGDLGTKGGVRTDLVGRVLRDDDSVIEGLYAAGNVSSPVMGHTYPGPGGTIGPAMTFGYLAALDIAGKK
ncbi:3-ketosteroid-delta-1-dehydrogenase [Mycolicibacterium peregrinum]|uniref:3-oxosteroid 1-dehydrogenase n=1 Tax=Mycolicibacterium peregrinum TaxID=43304 RepID=A0A1X2ALT4_MYCPR|nr:3-oxosteroid 1-dehydrogenase [Mycolicibacterium peregrinum]MCV7201205.1 3-oxosteroid 1-dehydrogenase [Mycolicibacterium peregrinum]ORW52348.1 3-ketosteroid-delta-1-dehydrogenase [Mycolicibacterium peregrinum]OWM05098.1 3-ketosteroid-delta-1-dehydrogenase [Mycolicibacterium peregrinum]TGB41620.1 3-oxosteroid 1-dehydrogenase [Mycolicibacterium peregrinum]TGB41656.1 3-oxosteroid 1-dehydrogenase [Mycolicibacterium peregrinum]